MPWISSCYQAVLAGINLLNAEYKSADSQPQAEAHSIFRHIPRIAKGCFFHCWNSRFLMSHLAIVEVGVVRKRGAQIKHGLELYHHASSLTWKKADWS